MNYLLDTSALLAHYRREPGWQQVQALFEEDAAEISMASVSVTEFARRLNDLGATEPDMKQTIEDYQLLMSEVVSVDTAVSHVAILLSIHTPQRLPLIDALIAAAAQSRDATLVHRDSHMAAIPRHLVRQQQLAPDS